MHVVINCITKLRHKDGATIYATSLASSLARLPGVRVSVLVGRGQRGCVTEDEGLHAVEIPIPSGPSALQWLFQPYLWWRLRKLQADVYHLPNSLPVLFKPCPTVITIHDLVDFRVRKYGWARTAYRYLTNYWGARRADCVITVSQSSRNDIISILHLASERIHVIYDGVGPCFRPIGKPECTELIRGKYGIEGRFVLGVGGWQGNKNMPGLITAMRKLWARGCPAKLIVLGNGSRARVQWMEQSRAEGFAERLLLPGYVPEEDLPPFYSAAELVVYPTLYEGFGLPALESMACGAPLLAFRTSSLPEVVGDAGALLEPGNDGALADAIEELLADPELRDKLSRRGIERARLFQWETTAERTLAVYAALTAVRSRRRGDASKHTISSGSSQPPENQHEQGVY